jgi:hypothetical protein
VIAEAERKSMLENALLRASAVSRPFRVGELITIQEYKGATE